MLDEIYKILSSNKLISGSQLLAHKVNFFSNINGFFSIDDNKFVQVKIAIEKPLNNEYEGLSDHNKVKQVIIPKVICFCKRNNYTYLVVQGIFHQMISSEDIVVKEKIISDHLLNYFSEIRYLQYDNFQQSIEEIFIASSGKYANEVCEIKSWIIEKKYELFSNLARRPQHCDFTINNIALQSDQLVIFDWEDYGEVDIEGFDLIIFICSICEFNIDNLQLLWHDKQSSYARLLFVFCKQFNLSMSDLWNMLPGYLLLFYQLKCELGYSKKISDLSKNLISGIITYS